MKRSPGSAPAKASPPRKPAGGPRRSGARNGPAGNGSRSVWNGFSGRRRARAPLNTKGNWFQSLFERALDAVLIADDQRRYVEANPAACELLGMSREEILRRRIDDFQPASMRSKVEGAWRELMRKGKMAGEWPLQLPDGRVRITEFRARARFLPGLHVSFMRDVTEQRRILDSLQESEERFRQLAEHIQEVFWIIDADTGRISYISPAYERIWGHRCEAIYANPLDWTEAIHPEDRDRITKIFHRSQAEGRMDQEYRIIRPDGTQRWIHDRMWPVRDASGRIRRLVGIAEDVTRRKQAEETLHRLNDELEQRVSKRSAQLEVSVAQLKDEIAQRRRVSKRLEAFVRLGHRLNAAASPREAAQIIVDVADQLLGWQACFLHLLTSSEDRFVPLLKMDEIRGRRRATLLLPSTGKLSQMARRVIREGAQLVLRGPSDRGSNGLIPFGNKKRRSRSLLLVPIRHSQKNVGILSIQSYEPDAYTRADLDTLQALADHCGGALERIRAQEKLRDSETQFASFMDNTTVVAWMKSEDGKYVYANSALTRLHRLSREKIVGKTDFELWPRPVAQELRANDRKVLQSGRMLSAMECVVSAEGKPFHGLVFKFPFRDNTGRRYVGGMAIDMTRRKEAEDALYASEARFRQLVDLLPVAVYSCDSVGRIIQYNPAAAALWGREPKLNEEGERFCGSYRIYRPNGEYLPHDRCPMAETIRTGVPARNAEVVIERPDSVRLHAVVNTTPIRDADGRMDGAINCIMDITERKAAEQVLRQLPRKILEAQEEERRHMAQVLHDDVSQLLASVQFRLRGVQEKVRNAEPRLSQYIAQAGKALDQAMKVIRGTAHQLHPADLLQEGLQGALASARTNFHQRLGIDVRLSVSQLADRLTPEVQVQLFRIVQEALTNVERHAQATRVSIQVSITKDRVRLQVADNGQGMSLRSLRARRRLAAGMGLAGMQKRASLLGGHFHLDTAKGQGMKILVEIPRGPLGKGRAHA